MARSIWTGSISFGLVNVPVSLVSAVRDQGVHFRQLHEKDGAPIDTRRFCAEEDVEVPWEEVVSGYEVKKGKWVTLSDEELAAAGVLRLPRTLGEAVDELEASDLAREVLGKELHATYARYKRAEWDEYNTVVGEWERERYLRVW